MYVDRAGLFSDRPWWVDSNTIRNVGDYGGGIKSGYSVLAPGAKVIYENVRLK